MDKEELLKEISKTEEHLVVMKKMLEGCEYKRWKPENDKIFYFVDSDGDVVDAYFDNSSNYDVGRYITYNCFRTKEQAELEAEKILVRRMLEDIAKRLNKDRVIDHYKNNLFKYYLYLDCDNKIYYGNHISISIQGAVYCLEGENFLNAAIREIGEERLKKYLRGE